MFIPEKIRKNINQNDFRKDEVGKSVAGVYLFNDMVLKVQPASVESENELQMMLWLKDKIAVPDIIEHTSENEYSYILMTRCQGHMSCAERYMKTPIKQVELLAETLQQLWSIPIENCPCNWSLEKRLQLAATNVASGSVDVTNAQPNTYGNSGFKNPEELLGWLMNNKPTETAVISHGDFCLPNIFVDNDKLTGLIDLGRAGISDKWHDIALCYRSLSNNYSGVYNGRKYRGFKDNILFDALEIDPDWDRIRYYILLDELF